MADQTEKVAAEAAVVDAPAIETKPEETPVDTPAQGTETPAEAVDNDPLSIKVTLADLCAKGTALYAQKNYDAAAEQYGKAAELQSQQNGELDPNNADILFLYGRCMFRLGQEKSDVLGGKAPEKKPAKDAAAADAPAASSASKGSALTGNGSADKDQALGAMSKESQALLDSKKPLFQFTGDENFDDSDDDDEDAAEENEGENEDDDDDDLAVAFEVLDLARVLFTNKLKQLQEEQEQSASASKGKAAEPANGLPELSPMERHVTERLADVHDLLGEISLENERYTNAITDARESLKYKKLLYTEESEVLAEAHFKLSLALEFASITTAPSGDDDADASAAAEAGPQQIDQALRDEAVAELEAALKSTKLKLQSKEVELATMASPEDNETTRTQIADVQEIIADMEQRLIDLRGPPIDLNTALAANPLGGVLSEALGASAAETQARIDEAKKSARDLSGLVRKKEKPAANAAPAEDTAAAKAAGLKRKADESLGAEQEEKRARTEEPAEETS
ncbi:hypothetical protein TD95_004057 [Thielaviopsis punctulata]|uniref:Tetratricopeptide SHNi-TPR domain-containing protein n=1 Tax=Thielaviopsis punctulata TaxID=72032 RepID=A0A0F4Z8U9_9PEZI|nr:hypothetical protein TD95_004057 [Thielaviopsis punctulata]